MDASSNQVKVIFTTNEADLQLPESKQQLLVPAGQSIVFPSQARKGACVELTL